MGTTQWVPLVYGVLFAGTEIKLIFKKEFVFEIRILA